MLAWLLFFAGVIQLGIASVALTMPRVLGMREKLRSVDPFVRTLVHVHTAFITLTIAGFAAITLFNAPSLAAGSMLAQCVCGFIGLFWGVRLVVQLWLLRAHPFRADRLKSLGFHGLSVAFVYLAAVFAVAALWE